MQQKKTNGFKMYVSFDFFTFYEIAQGGSLISVEGIAFLTL